MVCCKGPSKVVTTPVNYSALYNPAVTSLHPVVNIFHSKDSVSELTIKLFPDELLFNKANEEGKMTARVKITCLLSEKNSNNENITIDSLINDFKLEQNDINKRYFLTVELKAVKGHEYMLNTEVKDINRSTGVKLYNYINKTDIYNEQNFRVLYERNRQLMFNPKVNEKEKLFIVYNNPAIKKLYIKHYSDYQEIPAPAYSVIYEPDFYKSYDTLWAENYDGYIIFEPEKEGLYLIQADTNIQKGLSVMRFYEGYPKIETSDVMIRPIIYLDNSPKYNEIINSTNKKLAVDKYWLGLCSDNTERARQLIRIYYNRVFFANYYFTSYKEGWMTDRGMIFIIYGQPDIVNKDLQTETWKYIGGKMTEKIVFTFSRNENPYSNDHFVLNRTGINTYWREAVSSWQEGKIFSADEL